MATVHVARLGHNLDIQVLEEGGDGPVVVALHSSGLSSRQWVRLAIDLGRDHRFLAPDLSGSGKSSPWPSDRPFAFADDAAIVRSVITSLVGEAPLHLVGHSYGGLLALHIAREIPAQIASIAVYEPVTFGVLYGPLGGRILHEDAMRDLARSEPDALFGAKVGGGEEWLEGFIDYWNEPGAWRAMPDSTRAAFLRGGEKTFAEVRSLMVDRTPASAYGVIEAPTLIMSGSRSPIAIRTVCATLAAAIPMSRLEVLEGDNHMGPLIDHARVGALIADHVRLRR